MKFRKFRNSGRAIGDRRISPIGWCCLLARPPQSSRTWFVQLLTIFLLCLFLFFIFFFFSFQKLDPRELKAVFDKAKKPKEDPSVDIDRDIYSVYWSGAFKDIERNAADHSADEFVFFFCFVLLFFFLSTMLNPFSSSLQNSWPSSVSHL